MYDTAMPAWVEPSFGVGGPNEHEVGPRDWGDTLNSQDLAGEVEAQFGSTRFGANFSSDLWAVIVMIAALTGLWFIGGVLFRQVDVF